LFPSDEQFGQWVDSFVNVNLSFTAALHERSAAMWAAGNPDEFAEAKADRTSAKFCRRWKDHPRNRRQKSRAPYTNSRKIATPILTKL
jgi:hypothetical protein